MNPSKSLRQKQKPTYIFYNQHLFNYNLKPKLIYKLKRIRSFLWMAHTTFVDSRKYCLVSAFIQQIIHRPLPPEKMTITVARQLRVQRPTCTDRACTQNIMLRFRPRRRAPTSERHRTDAFATQHPSDFVNAAAVQAPIELISARSIMWYPTWENLMKSVPLLMNGRNGTLGNAMRSRVQRSWAFFFSFFRFIYRPKTYVDGFVTRKRFSTVRLDSTMYYTRDGDIRQQRLR